MRRELKEFREKNPESAEFLAETYRMVRRAEFSLLKMLMGTIVAGSPSWHLLQQLLARRSSLDVDLAVRSWFYSSSLAECGNRLCVLPDVLVSYPQNLSLGENVFINRGVTISAQAPVSIGSRALIGPRCVINSGNHRYNRADVPIRHQGHRVAPINVAEDVWLGAHVCVLAGTTIGRGAVVGAGSVVTRDVEPLTVVAGVPCKVIGRRG